ncbi:MAG TPA: hypothetical protein VIM16_22145 [Mucilaginibacter sp.]|jgi:predicted transposase/invertase (TIGR01784 family)
MKYKWDNKNVRDYAIEQARLEGREEGKLNVARRVALALKKEGFTIEFIVKTTGLTLEKIEKL